MIIARQKPFADILAMVGDAETVYIVGCGECATATETGGEREAQAMKAQLEAAGKRVTGIDVAHSVCQELDVKRLFRVRQADVAEAEVVLVLSCGAGSQSVRGATDKRVIAGTDTLFLGNSKRQLDYEEKCTLCGDCVIDRFGGICPIARCSKGLVNGPCGGSDHGKCEVDPERDCAWVLIFEALEKQGRLEDATVIQPPRSWDQSRRPGHVNWREGRRRTVAQPVVAAARVAAAKTGASQAAASATGLAAAETGASQAAASAADPKVVGVDEDPGS